MSLAVGTKPLRKPWGAFTRTRSPPSSASEAVPIGRAATAVHYRPPSAAPRPRPDAHAPPPGGGSLEPPGRRPGGGPPPRRSADPSARTVAGLVSAARARSRRRRAGGVDRHLGDRGRAR